jgi:phosphonate transport system substrate-binding protein
MTGDRRFASWRTMIGGLLALALLAASCGDDDATQSGATAPTGDTTADAGGAGGSSEADGFSGTLRVSAIPDQDPDLLLRSYDQLAAHLEGALPGVSVEYVPATDYQGVVSAFRVGDLDLVWFGGLTGVQARLEVDGAQAIAQRDIDQEFTSVFIARADTGIEPITDVAGLSALAGRSLTFGSESSTSGRLMPQSFLSEAGLDIDSSFTGPVGFSGSHDATIEVVRAGTYEVGALNSQVWDARVADASVDPDEVVELFRTPEYVDYHWVVQPDLDDSFGDGFQAALLEAFVALDASDPTEAAILDFFGAGGFVETSNDDYAAIEAVAREIGAIRG